MELGEYINDNSPVTLEVAKEEWEALTEHTFTEAIIDSSGGTVDVTFKTNN